MNLEEFKNYLTKLENKEIDYLNGGKLYLPIDDDDTNISEYNIELYIPDKDCYFILSVTGWYTYRSPKSEPDLGDIDSDIDEVFVFDPDTGDLLTIDPETHERLINWVKSNIGWE